MNKKNRPTSTSWTIQFDHAAVAVKDTTKFKRLLELLGIGFQGSEVVENQKVETFFYSAENSTTNVELLVPTSDDSTIATYLSKRGSGIHHLSFKVSDILAVSKVLKENSIRLIYDQPKPGAHNTKVNFIHPESTGGILIEISQ
jgi:methylmalonyl-CoA/ethylmalonyl-CoA epimerase